MKNRFLEAVLMKRADEQCEALGVRAKERPDAPTESPRLPVYRERGARLPNTPNRQKAREWDRNQRKIAVAVWSALRIGDVEAARAAAVGLSPGRLTELKLRWVGKTSERWPL